MQEADRRISILLLEGDEDDIMLIEGWVGEFQHYQATLHATTDPAGAQALIESGVYDLILVDYLFEVPSCNMLIQDAISSGSRVPILVLSDWPDERVEQESLQSGAFAFLHKEVLTTNSLEKAIQLALE